MPSSLIGWLQNSPLSPLSLFNFAFPKNPKGPSPLSYSICHFDIFFGQEK
jgi:hypothetical protein